VSSLFLHLFSLSFFFISSFSIEPSPPLSPPLFVERLSLGAIWVYLIQQVLPPDYRPLFPLSKETGPGLVAVT
jgi:hypothetical protein